MLTPIKGKKIVICDDHDLFLNGISEILKRFGINYEVVTFNNTKSCKEYIQQNAVDVFICDLNIDNKDGFELMQELNTELKLTKKIILTAYYEDFLIRKAERKGIHAFLKKETNAEELMLVLESKPGADFYTNKPVRKEVSTFTQKDVAVSNKFRLSNQEKAIIKLIVASKASKEIAIILSISKTTVDTHRKNINRKLEISNTSTLIKFARENNLSI